MQEDRDLNALRSGLSWQRIGVVIAGLLVFYWTYSHLLPSTRDGRPVSAEVLEELRQTGIRIAGSDSSQVTIFEFADVQCPSCRLAHETMSRVIEQVDGDVELLLLHYPLPSHTFAWSGALSLECAQDQGVLVEMYDLIFTRSEMIGRWDWSEYANRAGVSDLDKFQECLTTAAYAEEVETHIQLGRKVGVSGTPTFVVDGRAFSGSPDGEFLMRWIRTQVESGG